MINKIKALFKGYLIEITWDNGKRETVLIKAWSPSNAIKKVSKIKDVVNKADMTILNISPEVKIRHCGIESLGTAKIKE